MNRLMDKTAKAPLALPPNFINTFPTTSNEPTRSLMLCNARRYLRELPYPLPCDLAEYHRQNLSTQIRVKVLGRPICSPWENASPPRRVLELCCGTAYWSTLCHDYLQSHGVPNVAFTGLDVVAAPPDLGKQGMDWRFVQHDIRNVPLPFDDAEFDVVMLKDVALTLYQGVQSQRVLDEVVRILKPGGFLEFWETDHILRSLLPHSPLSKSASGGDSAISSGAFLMGPGTPFATAQNKYIKDYNTWIHEALAERKLPSAPCAILAEMLLQESELLKDFGYRRVAIPLAETRWEHDMGEDETSTDSDSTSDSPPQIRKGLNPDQLALRNSCLVTVIQMIEALEPLLRDVSGKSEDEWQRWWAGMTSSLLEGNGMTNGECLEAGAWWARKV
ncbi:MAG: hypothetical protein M1820_003953 [Bogoriella megaspora]|nr:MAG: hypothetical protein M1820_003953 [Bogoriella megaspora]